MVESRDHDSMTRRRTLAVGGGTVLTFALAGCSTDGDGEDTPTEPATATPTEGTEPAGETAESTGTGPDAGSVGPLDVPDDANCAVCNMLPAKFPDYNAQLQYESADPQFFCSNGCMASFAAIPDHFDESYADASIAAAFVHDHDTKAWIDGQAASYVLEMNADRVDDPMRINPLAFDTEADAVAYVEEYDDLSSDDIVGFDDFDRDLAEQYRASFFE